MGVIFYVMLFSVYKIVKNLFFPQYILFNSKRAFCNYVIYNF